MSDHREAIKEPETEQEKAESYAALIRSRLVNIGQIMDRAQLDGLLVNFQMGKDQMGKNVVAGVSIVKVLA